MALQLGIIPDYQFSHDPSVNFALINPHVKFPAGMDQLTVQPVGPYVTSGDSNLNGLGRVRDHRRFTTTSWSPTTSVYRTARAGCSGQCWPGCTSLPDCSCDCPDRTRNVAGLGVTMVNRDFTEPAGLYKQRRQITPLGGLGMFDSTWWQNRKWLAFGIVGILGLGAGAIALKVLR